MPIAPVLKFVLLVVVKTALNVDAMLTVPLDSPVSITSVLKNLNVASTEIVPTVRAVLMGFVSRAVLMMGNVLMVLFV